MLLRVRATSFLAGVALAGAVAYFQLRQDLLQSQQVLIDQASKFNCEELEKRVADIESSLADLKKQQ
ncbi:g5263 [Coccomyxa elongata]